MPMRTTYIPAERLKWQVYVLRINCAWEIRNDRSIQTKNLGCKRFGKVLKNKPGSDRNAKKPMIMLLGIDNSKSKSTTATTARNFIMQIQAINRLV